MKKFDAEVKNELKKQGLIDTVLEIGWNYLQAQKEGGSND